MEAQEVSFPGDFDPRSNAQDHHNRGRKPVRPAPDITPFPEWADAWDGHELRELSRERSRNTIANKKCVIMIMARHFTAEGATDPTAVTKTQVNRYLLRQYADRKPGGRVALYQTVKSFFDWMAAEYETANPMAGIPRPRGGAEPVPVVQPDELPALLRACKASTALGTARNTAIILAHDRERPAPLRGDQARPQRHRP